MIESGLDVELPFWTAIYAPIRTPKPVIDKLNAAITKAIKNQGVTDRLADVGTEVVGSTVAETDAFTRRPFGQSIALKNLSQSWETSNSTVKRLLGAVVNAKILTMGLLRT